MRRIVTWLQVLLATSFIGTAFQPGTGCMHRVARNINPCGTLLFCDPLEYDLLFFDIDDFPDWNVDPTCTIPGFCGGNVPFPPGATPGIGAGVGGGAAP